MTEPPLPSDSDASKPNGPQQVTLRDVLRAVFLPERKDTAVTLIDTGEMLRAVGSVTRSLPTPQSQPDFVIADTPGVIAYPEPVQPAEVGEESRPWVVLMGIFVAFGVTVLGQLAAAGAPEGLIAWVLFALGAGLWLALLLFQVAIEHRELMLRGPTVSGGGATRPLSLPDRYDLILRITLAGAGIAFGVMAYFLASDNTFRPMGVATWFTSTLCIAVLFAERDVLEMLGSIGDDIKGLRERFIEGAKLTPILLLILIIGMGAFFRYFQLDATPGEMTSDHIEKLLDAYRIAEEGTTSVFFVNNGGREALHFYVVALTAQLFGTGWTFLTLKLTSAFWAMLLLPVIVLLGRELVDWETGLWAAGLLAMSWWHIMLARLALRISLTPLIFCLIMICLLRGVRTGSRRAWIWAGIWMGVGVYSYQAMRLTPLVAVAACLIAIAFPAMKAFQAQRQQAADVSIKQAKARNAVLRQVINLTAAGLIAGTMFIPMLRVWVEFPQQLWNRVINRTTNNESPIEGTAATVFADNYYDALRMYNFEGDSAWISSAPGAPTLDLITGAFFVLGVSLWLVRLLLRQDAAEWFLAAAILLMLLPSALAIAFPIENPSTTRASGTLPLVMVLAAWPISLIRQYTVRVHAMFLHPLATYGFLVVVLLGIAGLNYNTFFNDYHQMYLRASPYPRLLATAAQEALIEANGSPEDIDGVWLVSYPFWQDHRAFGAELGDITYEQVLLDSNALANSLVTTPEQYEARPLVFVLNQNDELGIDVLEALYPEGRVQRIDTQWEGKDFYIYTAPETSE